MLPYFYQVSCKSSFTQVIPSHFLSAPSGWRPCAGPAGHRQRRRLAGASERRRQQQQPQRPPQRPERANQRPQNRPPRAQIHLPTPGMPSAPRPWLLLSNWPVQASCLHAPWLVLSNRRQHCLSMPHACLLIFWLCARWASQENQQHVLQKLWRSIEQDCMTEMGPLQWHSPPLQDPPLIQIYCDSAIAGNTARLRLCWKYLLNFTTLQYRLANGSRIREMRDLLLSAPTLALNYFLTCGAAGCAAERDGEQRRAEHAKQPRSEPAERAGHAEPAGAHSRARQLHRHR